MTIWRGVAFGFGLVASAASGHGEARYLGNEGVLVSRGETKVLFDAFYAESFGGTYTLLPTALEQAMMAGTAPFDGVDAVFVSHIHPDHFNSRKLIAYLRAHPQVKLYAGFDVIGAIYAADVSVDDPISRRMIRVHVAPGDKAKTFQLPGIDVEALSIPHSGNQAVAHYAFRVTLDKAATVLHLGDSDDGDQHFAPYQADLDARRTDTAFAPTWMMTSDSGRRILEQRIRPGKVVGIHAEEKLRTDPRARAELKGDVFLDPGETRTVGEGPR